MLSIRYNSPIKSWRNRKNPERTTKIKPCIDKYNWEGINYPSEKDDWKITEKNNLTIGFNVLYGKKEKIYPAFVSKHNSNCEKQVILLMISNRQGSHYLALKTPISIIKKNNTVWIVFILLAFF